MRKIKNDIQGNLSLVYLPVVFVCLAIVRKSKVCLYLVQLSVAIISLTLLFIERKPWLLDIKLINYKVNYLRHGTLISYLE